MGVDFSKVEIVDFFLVGAIFEGFFQGQSTGVKFYFTNWNVIEKHCSTKN